MSTSDAVLENKDRAERQSGDILGKLLSQLCCCSPATLCQGLGPVGDQPHPTPPPTGPPEPFCTTPEQAEPACRNTTHTRLTPAHPSLPLSAHQGFPEIQGCCRSLQLEGRGSAAEALLPQAPVLPTFFFFFRMTFTPSTDTMRFTFFFLMFLALNSYCRRWKKTPELAFLCQDSPGEG